MSTNRSKDRSSLCSFMFVDGRHCACPVAPVFRGRRGIFSAAKTPSTLAYLGQTLVQAMRR